VADLEWMATGRRGNLLSFLARAGVHGGREAGGRKSRSGGQGIRTAWAGGAEGFLALSRFAPVRDPPLARGQSRARRG
jgi:hypothetical protein